MPKPVISVFLMIKLRQRKDKRALQNGNRKERGMTEATSKLFRITPGNPERRGAFIHAGGIDFAMCVPEDAKADLILITDHWGPNHQPGRSNNSEEYETVNAYHLRIRENDTSIGELGTVRDDKSRHKGAPPILYVDNHVTINNWKTTIPPRFYDLTTAYEKGLGWQGRAVGRWSDAKCVKK